MTDAFGRSITYLRLSVTDLCNLRCRYCMGEDGVRKLRRKDILTYEEMEEAVAVAVRLGVRKVRITGGEPLVRGGITDICRRLREIPGLEELCLTTNGVLLPQYAADLRQVGVDRLNVSLDTLRSERYEEITRGGALADVLVGLEAARSAGFPPAKINCVLMGGFNDDEIPDFVALTRNHAVSVRFIELMPMGECLHWERSRFISAQAVLEAIPALESVGTDGVARLYRLPGAAGTVGLISPVSNHFCPACNRLRLTADGKLKPCLHSSQEINIRGLHGTALEEAFLQAVKTKPEGHHLSAGSNSGRPMNAIGG